MKIAKEIGDQDGEGGAYGSFANAYRSLTHYQKAIEYHGALSIRPKFPEIPGWGANGTDIFLNFIPTFWEYLAWLA